MSARTFTGVIFALALLGTGVSAQAANNAAYVSQTVPASMVYQKTYAVSVTMQNTGTTTWTAAGAYRLGYWYENNTWGVQRVELPNSVSPSQQVTFNFNVTATSNAPTSNFRWMMVQDGVQWFGASSPLVQIPVRVNAAAFISQSVPGTMVANQASAVTVTMRNNGFHTWNAGAYYLASDNPPDNTAFGLNRVELPGPVGAGQNVTFSFNAVPPSSGTKNFQWRIVDSIEGAFGSASTNVAVAVSGTDSSQYVSQSVPGSMAAGQSYAVSVTLANNGNTTWSAADSFKLAPHPLPDNNTWGITRVNLPGPVSPGQQVTIPFNVTAPTLTGVYSFQWRMLHEGTGAFGAASPNVGFPIGTISTEVLFIHVDHLNTPRLVADDQQRSVWRWDQLEPFGVNVPDENPSGLGAFAFNLRFPGQYFDKETGLAYNYFRDYDANIGRYVESDPIGLAGGVNTYSYAAGNPLANIDVNGLECVSANGQTTCTFPGGSPSFRVTTPQGFPTSLLTNPLLHHEYVVEVSIGTADPKCVMQKMIDNPTSGPSKPAVPGGVLNNAPVPILAPNNPVYSYLTPGLVGSTAGDPMVVNMSIGGNSAFHPGYVVRYVSNGKAYTLGEGAHPSQSGYLTGRLTHAIGNQLVWGNQMRRFVEECLCKKI